MLIAIGSKNPVKVKAVKDVFQKVFGDIRVIALDTASGVSNQPMSAQETRQGAVNRSKEALSATKGALFGVGVEGGVERIEAGLMLCGFVAVVNEEGGLGIGGGTLLLLPPLVEEGLRMGEELGDIIDHLAGESNTKQRMGTPGVLTHGLTDREEFFKIATAYALVPFINPEFY